MRSPPRSCFTGASGIVGPVDLRWSSGICSVWRQHKITPQGLQTDAREEKENTARFSRFLDLHLPSSEARQHAPISIEMSANVYKSSPPGRKTGHSDITTFAMNDARRVRGVESIGDFNGQGHRRTQIERAFGDTLPEIHAVEELHGDETAAVVLADLVNRGDTRMVEPRHRLARKLNPQSSMLGEPPSTSVASRKQRSAPASGARLSDVRGADVVGGERRRRCGVGDQAAMVSTAWGVVGRKT